MQPNGTIINKTSFLLSTYHVRDIVVGFVFNIKHKYYVSGLSEYHKVTRKQGVLKVVSLKEIEVRYIKYLLYTTLKSFGFISHSSIAL